MLFYGIARLFPLKHCDSGDVKVNVTKKKYSIIFRTEIVLKGYFWPNAFNKTILSCKYIHWFGFNGRTLNCI